LIRVLVADDHPLLRNGLKLTFSEEPDLAVTAEAEDSEQVLQRLGEESCDVVILDITMPGRDGLDVLRDIRRLRPNLPVLILSLHSEQRFAMRAIQAGASGYLNKECAPAELVQAVRKVVTGKRYVSPRLAEAMADALAAGEERPPHELLSDREFQILCRIASGRTVSQVAAELSLSVKTVSTYRARMLEKMGMRNNAQITRYAVQKGLVD
jgi:two-component system, NarL family, invasion response regulator UvrY